MIRPLSNSLNCEKCLLARLRGVFRLPKSSYNRRVIVTFMNLRICAGLYCRTHNLLQVPIAELAERWTELPQVSGSNPGPGRFILTLGARYNTGLRTSPTGDELCFYTLRNIREIPSMHSKE
ncbi:hypothetical protein TNCV_2916461 [Trichonephila clavipes]|nr:hypothetical protein TNCV_2916461 [Trichonephila clavipes]